MLKTIIFDMDGVLVDSEKFFFETDKRLLEGFGYSLEREYYNQFVGGTVDAMWESFIKDFHLPYTVSELDKLGRDILARLLEESGGYPAVPFAKELVKELAKSYTLVIASSSSMESIERNLKHIGVYDYFSGFVSGRELTRTKPDPEIFLRAAELSGSNPGECIVIEDSQNGIKAAVAAGMSSVGYIGDENGTQDLSKADYLVSSFEGLEGSFFEMVHCHHHKIPWTVLRTERLTIRELEKEDIEDFIDTIRKNHPTDIVGLPKDCSMEEFLSVDYMWAFAENMYKLYGYGIWAIDHRKLKVNIGYVVLDEMNYIGYVIKEAYRNQGFCREAIDEIVDYIRSEELMEYILAKVHRNNRNNRISEQILNDIGFVKESEATAGDCSLWSLSLRNG